MERRDGFYWHVAEHGTFRIEFQSARNLWGVWFSTECLGEYDGPEAALLRVTQGRTTWPAAGDPSKMDLPLQLADWNFLRQTR